MSRPLRIEDPGTWYPVMNRRRRKEVIFLSLQDYGTTATVVQKFSALSSVLISGHFSIHCHCLLLFHLPEIYMSSCVCHIGGAHNLFNQPFYSFRNLQSLSGFFTVKESIAKRIGHVLFSRVIGVRLELREKITLRLKGRSAFLDALSVFSKYCILELRTFTQGELYGANMR